MCHNVNLVPYESYGTAKLPLCMPTNAKLRRPLCPRGIPTKLVKSGHERKIPPSISNQNITDIFHIETDANL